MQLPDARRPILIEEFSEERLSPRAAKSAGEQALTIGRFPIASGPIVACAKLLTLVQRDYARTIGTHRSSRPRTQSLVDRRVERSAADVLSRLSTSDLEVAAGPTRLAGNPLAVTYDPIDHEYRIPCTLRIPFSWPSLPMWLAVGELSSNRCTVRLSLRSRKRLRYPARYFHVAHAVLSRLELRLTS